MSCCLAVVVSLTALGSCSEKKEIGAACSGNSGTRPAKLVPNVVRTFPHATDAFTEGLVIHDDVLYESTGMEGKSTLRALDPMTGKERDRADLPDDVFGEGLAVGADDQLVQLSWKNGTAFVWDRNPLNVAKKFTFTGEGWGLTTVDDGRLLMSNGSNKLTIRDATTFKSEGTVSVTRPGGGTDQLNELEADGDAVWANRFQSAEILRIDLSCGGVTGSVDASALVKDAQDSSTGVQPDVLNGIAKIPGSDHFLVTGKYWPKFYEVTFDPA